MNFKIKYGYTVYEDGTIIKPNGQPLKYSTTDKGYQICTVYWPKRTTKSQHRLVAESFLGACPDGYEVNHIDCNRKHNHISNLEYLTKSQNNKYSYDMGNRDVSGTKNANCKYAISTIHTICQRLERGDYPTVTWLSKELGVPRSLIHVIKSKKQWRDVSKGYEW